MYIMSKTIPNIMKTVTPSLTLKAYQNNIPYSTYKSTSKI